jgi:glycosyltransferase involved in cell wall biosynthesis
MLLGRRHSGVEGSIHNLVQALADSGKNEYTLFTGSATGRSGALVTPEPDEGGMPPDIGGQRSARRTPTITSTRWPVRFRPLRILWEQLALPPLLKHGHFDLLHAPGYIAPLLSSVPVVITLYDLIALSHPGLCTRSNRWHYRLLVPLSVRKATRIIVPSQTTRNDLLRFFPAAADKTRVIPLGIGAEFRVLQDEAAGERLRRKHRLPAHFILFVGGLEPKKNLPRLIESYQRLRRHSALPHQLVIAGTPSWDHAAVKRSIRQLGLEDSVILTGFVPPEELPLLYNMADLFVFPSLYEGFGLPPLEAMACGTPVVISDRGALPEIAGTAAVITDPLSPERMAAAMESILTNPALRNELRSKGLAHARNFSWAATAAATEAVYEEATRSCPSKPKGPVARIAYVLGTFPSLTETFILREILELQRQGVELMLFSLRHPAGGPQPADTVALTPSVCYRPSLLSLRVMAAQGYFLCRHPLRLFRALGLAATASGGGPIDRLKCLRNLPVAAFFARRAAGWGATHVHAHFAFMPTDVARMMAELMGTRFSFSAHAADIYLQPAAVLARKVKAAQFVTVCTRYGVGELAGKIGPVLAAKVQLLYHGLPKAPFEREAGQTAPLLVLAVGRLQPKKGFGVLIAACGLLRDRGVAFRCLIAGEGPERRPLQDAIARLGLSDLVTLRGECSQEEVSVLLGKATVFALPCVIAPDGDRDSLPNVILEALTAGVPVVTTPVAGIPEVIEPGRTGLLAPPGEARALAAAIEELLKNEPLCRTIRVLGKAVVAERFDIARNVAPLAERFRQM